MPTFLTLIFAACGILAAGALLVGYVVWRDRRRAEDAQARRDAAAAAWGETAAEDTDQQAQRPIWRPD